MFGPAGGMIINGFLKGQFNPGIDIQFSKDVQKSNDYESSTRFYPFYNKIDTVYNSNIKTYNSITDIKLNFEFTSPQVDTISVAVGLQFGAAYLQDRIYFDNPDLPDFELKTWSPIYGAYGVIRRNYILGTPLQLFFSLSVQGYTIKNPVKKTGPITTVFEGANNLSIGYVKLGLAYKFN
jgi:hypothetical protein